MSYYKLIKDNKIIAFSELPLNSVGAICQEITKQEYDVLVNNQNLKLENEKQITELKQKLASTDYKAIKYAEGLISAEEYAETKEQRQKWREEINELEGGGNE